MHQPNVTTEYTTVHVDDSFSNDVSVRTQVNVYTAGETDNENRLLEYGSKKHEAALIGMDYAVKEENEQTDLLPRNNTMNLGSKKSNKQNHAVKDENEQITLLAAGNNAMNLSGKKSKKQILEGSQSRHIISNENRKGSGDIAISQNKKDQAISVNLNNNQINATQTLDKDNINKKMNLRIEKHKLYVVGHNLVVSGVKVSERKERTTVTQKDINGNSGDGLPIKTMLVNSRTIGLRTYAIKETRDKDGIITDSNVVTEMSEEETKKFEEDWKIYWIPTISDAQIESGEFEAQIPTIVAEPVDSEESEVQRKDTDENVLQYEHDYTLSEESPDISTQDDIHTIISERQQEKDSLIEALVKSNPLKVFYFGLTMLMIAVFVFQCCFLPEYPPCSWFKAFMNCILECIEKANNC